MQLCEVKSSQNQTDRIHRAQWVDWETLILVELQHLIFSVVVSGHSPYIIYPFDTKRLPRHLASHTDDGGVLSWDRLGNEIIFYVLKPSPVAVFPMGQGCNNENKKQETIEWISSRGISTSFFVNKQIWKLKWNERLLNGWMESNWMGHIEECTLYEHTKWKRWSSAFIRMRRHNSTLAGDGNININMYKSTTWIRIRIKMQTKTTATTPEQASWC